jgi:hypothetical protein
MKFIFNDGGRAAAGRKGYTGDCVTRSICIATGLEYNYVYNSLDQIALLHERKGKKKGISKSGTGVYRTTYDKFLKSIGWKWVPCMGIGTGCRFHLRDGELPMGKLIVSVSKHITCVIDGVINDTFDCQRNGTRCVYGYYIKE